MLNTRYTQKDCLNNVLLLSLVQNYTEKLCISPCLCVHNEQFVVDHIMIDISCVSYVYKDYLYSMDKES